MPRGGMAARGPPVGVLRSAAHRRAESRFWGVFIFAVHRAFVLGLGARHRGIVDLSEGVIRCVTVFACYSSSSSSCTEEVVSSLSYLLTYCTEESGDVLSCLSENAGPQHSDSRPRREVSSSSASSK